MDGDDTIIFLIWLAAAIYILAALGVFRAGSLRRAPIRHGAISLALIFAIALLYILAMQTAVAIAVSQGVRVFPPEAATQPASASAPVTTAAASAPATSPATQPPDDLQITLNGQLLDTAARTVAVLGLLLFLPRLLDGGWRGFGLSPGKFHRHFAAGFLAYICIMPALEMIGEVTQVIYRYFHEGPHNETPPLHPTIQALEGLLTPGQQFLFIFLAGVVAPIFEEIFFRGVIQTALVQRRWGLVIERRFLGPAAEPPVYQRWAAILISSAAFSAVHPFWDRPVIFCLAVALGYLYERTGNLWPGIILHGAFNGSTLYFVLTHKDIINGG